MLCLGSPNLLEPFRSLVLYSGCLGLLYFEFRFFLVMNSLPLSRSIFRRLRLYLGMGLKLEQDRAI